MADVYYIAACALIEMSDEDIVVIKNESQIVNNYWNLGLSYFYNVNIISSFKNWLFCIGNVWMKSKIGTSSP